MIDYFIHIIIIVLLFIVLSESLMLTSGFSGLISLSHAAFYGIGAYSSAILSLNFEVSISVTFLASLLISGLLGVLVSTLALRSVDDYFIIITLGIQIVIFSVMNNWIELTNGSLGISGIPAIDIFGFKINDNLDYLILVLCISFLLILIIRNIITSPFGRILISTGSDELFIISLGKNVTKIKVLSFSIGAMIASVSGVLYAHYVSYIDPSSFSIDESIFILSIVIIGGMRNIKGVALAALLLVILPELLRFIGLPNNIAGNVRQLIYGLALIVMMIKYKNGFVSKPYQGKEIKHYRD